jgi:uncharacterized protein (TIGR01777 family)
MKILISGGSGLIGSALTRSLLEDDHQVWILTRNPTGVGLPAGATSVQWDGHTNISWLGVFSQMDAVVNLAGETVGKWPWNSAHKKRILESRVNAGRAITDAFQKAEKKPAVLIQSSGIGFYGPCGDVPITEDFPAGNDFMAQVASQWEDSTRSVDDLPGVRRAIIRTSLVLDARQGVLPLMALPVRFFAGGPLGGGLQGVSWIHIDDEIRAIRFLMENDAACGAFNLSSPQPLSNAKFIQALAKTLSRPCWLPAPGFALRALLGEMSTLLLDGQFALPQKLASLGFVFRFPHAEQAFQALF